MLEKELLGQRIANARKAKGLSEQQLALRLGVEKSSVENWEAAVTAPRANILDQIARILGVPLMWIMAGDKTLPEHAVPDLNATGGIEEKLARAEDLITQLSFLLVDIRQDTRRLQKNLDE